MKHFKIILLFLALTLPLFAGDVYTNHPRSVLDPPWEMRGSGVWLSSSTADLSDSNKIIRVIDNVEQSFKVMAGTDEYMRFDTLNKAVIFPDIYTNSIMLDLTSTATPREGLMYWNADDGTVNIGMPGGNVNLQVGQEMTIRVTNGTASQIDNGTPVYVSGASGSNIIVGLADADFSTGVGFRTIAVATEDIAASQKGYVTTVGMVRGLKTDTFSAEGIVLYLASGGGFTETPPAPPDIAVVCGILTRKHIEEGSIYITITSIPNLNNLSDVVQATADKDLLQWNSATSVWDTGPNVRAPLTIGDGIGTDSTGFEADGTAVFNGEATVWDDLRFPVSLLNLGLINAPTLTPYKGGITLAFGDVGVENQEEDIYFTAQLPHSYKEGSDIDVHIHWTPEDNTAGNVYWTFSHSWSNIGGTFPTETEIDVAIACDTVTDKHQSDELVVLDGTGKTISSVLICRLTRHSSNALDTYDGKEPYLHEIDFHYEIDTVGSREELTK